MNYFFSYEDAKRFAESVDYLGNVNRIPAEDKIELSRVYKMNCDVLQQFCIDGFTKIIPVYAFRQDWNNVKDEPKQSWYLDYTTLALCNLVSGELYLMVQTKYNSKMFRLYPFYNDLPRLAYFETELVEPNAVGKPTRKNWRIGLSTLATSTGKNLIM